MIDADISNSSYDAADGVRVSMSVRPLRSHRRMRAAGESDAIADFYRARTVTVVVSSSAAGGYDTLARVVARYMGRHLPGNPVFIVRNMPGAGGIAATNFLYNNAEQRWQRHWPCSEQHAIRAALRHQGGTL